MQPVLFPVLRDLLALHVIAAICWIAGKIILPLIYQQHWRLQRSDPARAEFAALERLIFKQLVNPAMYATWIVGILLVLTPGTMSWSAPWWLVKFAAVLLLLSWLHGGLSISPGRLRDDDAAGPAQPTLRQGVAVPFALLAVIVTMAIIQP